MKQSKVGREHSGGKSRGSDMLGPHSEIGRKLRQYYDEILSDEVPDRFTQLLTRLEQTEPVSKKD